MDYSVIADMLFPDVTETVDEIRKKYPPRNLPEGAKVTRFAPSPTGFIHLGGIYGATIDERLAHQSKGVFYLRIEDTDRKREVPGAAQALIRTLAEYGLEFDEGAAIDAEGNICDNGAYGPYRQSRRAGIYHVYAKKLVSEGKAYPVFSADGAADADPAERKAEIKSRIRTEESAAEDRRKMLAERAVTEEEIKDHIAAGDRFVLKILSDGDGEKKVFAEDLVRGKLEFPENDEDFVLLKSDGIPTYHFAHVVDDYLMGTTHVIRGEEWLPSLPKHLQLFRYLGIRPPKYLHTAQIMKLDENGNKKKLSKRDMGLDMNDYRRGGYLPVCVSEYVMTILNSNYDEWRMQNKDRPYKDFPFSIKKMSNSGCLLDLPKLHDVSKNIISAMTADELLSGYLGWAREYENDFAKIIDADRDYAIAILSIGRNAKKPRKDIATYRDVRHYMEFFYPDLFRKEDDYPEGFDRGLIKTLLREYAAVYDHADDNGEWFGKIKKIAENHGFASDMKLYRENPGAYAGSVADVSAFIRIALTGRRNSPDMYDVTRVLGGAEVLRRLQLAVSEL